MFRNTISGSCLGRSKKNQMMNFLGHGRNRLTTPSSTIGQKQRVLTLRVWQGWQDASVRWMTGCCAAQKVGGIDWRWSRRQI